MAIRRQNEFLEEKIVASQRKYDGRIFNVDEVDVVLPNGKPAKRDVVRHNGAVAIVALDEKDRILLVHQFRVPLERITLEIPAGRLEQGEDPLQAARRELSEETGYEAQDVQYLQSVAVAAGYSDEIIHLVLATKLIPGDTHPDEDEFVVSEWLDISKFLKYAYEGKIEDSKTLIAALHLSMSTEF